MIRVSIPNCDSTLQFEFDFLLLSACTRSIDFPLLRLCLDAIEKVSDWSELDSKKEEGSDSPVEGLRGCGGLYRCVVILLYTLRAMTRMRIQATQRSHGESGVNSFVAMKVSWDRRVILVKVVHASPGIFDEAGESYMNMLPSPTGGIAFPKKSRVLAFLSLLSDGR